MNLSVTEGGVPWMSLFREGGAYLEREEPIYRGRSLFRDGGRDEGLVRRSVLNW